MNKMIMANINPVTQIRFGVISGNSIDPDILDRLYDIAYNAVYQIAKFQFMKDYANERDFEYHDMSADELENALADEFIEFSGELDHFTESVCIEEPSGEFNYDKVIGSFSYLGGAPIVFVSESEYLTNAALCSPCVPNAGDLDNKGADGVECYDIPPHWYAINNDEE